MREKSKRNIDIYNLVKSGLPQRVVARLYGLSSSAVWEIYNRYAEKYGRSQPTTIIMHVRITPNDDKLLTNEADRLQTAKTSIMQLAINQAIKKEGFPKTKSLEIGGLSKDLYLTISAYQNHYIDQLVSDLDISQSQAVRLIIENYQSIDLPEQE